VTRSLALLAAAAAGLLSAACGGPDGAGEAVSGSDPPLIDTTAVVADPAPDATVENTTRDAAEEGDVQPAGGATLTIGETTWTFNGVVCLFGEAATQVDAEFAMSGVADGVEIYAEIGVDGDVVTVEDPRDDPAHPLSMTSKDANRFVRVNGTNVTARATFVPLGDPGAAGTPGRLEADCA
jgi:hypothetical protein